MPFLTHFSSITIAQEEEEKKDEIYIQELSLFTPNHH